MTMNETDSGKDSLPSAAPKEKGEWERELLTRLAFAALTEQRRARRWGIVFKMGMLVYLTVVLVMAVPASWTDLGSAERHTAVVDVFGAISADSDASASRIIQGLRAAFEDENTAGIILRINSPGGSPVQAGYVNDEIRRLRKKNPAIPVYAVVADFCASGAYYIAAAADRIYADKASIVGSIGVVINGFGFVDAMKNLGVERRLLTAGEHKGMLDPFSPVRESETAHMRKMLGDIHQQFIDVVRRGRGDKLREGDDAKLFSGLIWTGEQSVAIGLVDELGSPGFVAREVIGVDNIVNFTPRQSLLRKLFKLLGVSIGEGVAMNFDLGQLKLR